MKKSYVLIILSTCIMFMLVGLSSCKKELKPVKYELVDNDRHYYPIMQGKTMDMMFEIRDTCDNPLFIQEVQTSVGLTLQEDIPIIVLPHKSILLRVKYDSTKHIGRVDHFINLFGNFERPDGKLVDTTMVTINFDINVVPPGDYYHDYEQYYFEDEAKSTIRNAVDGADGSKRYYMSDGRYDFSESGQKEEENEND